MKKVLVAMTVLGTGGACVPAPPTEDAPRGAIPAAARCTDADGCSPAGDGNDTFATADPITAQHGEVETGVQGVISVPGDVDLYAYRSPGGEWLRIWTRTDEGAELDTVLSVHAPNGSLHHVLDDFGTGPVSTHDSLMHVYLPHPGTWFIRVEDRSTHYGESPRGGPEFRYTLGVEPWSGGAEEPDSPDAPAAHFDLADGTTTYPWGVVIDHPGDADHATVQMPYGDVPFEVWAPIRIPGSGLRARVTVVDGDGRRLMRKDDVGPNGIAVYFDASHTTLRVSVGEVRADRGDGDHWTVLYLRTRPPGYGNPREVEPNDARGEATELAAEPVTEDGRRTDRAFLQGVLATPGDEDWWSLRGGGSLRLACSSSRFGSGGDVQVDVVGPAGEVVATVTDGDDSAPDVASLPVPDDGPYALRFYEQDGIGDPGVYYRCGVYVRR